MQSWAWRQDAACKNMDPNLFYPSNNSTRQTNAAKAICRGCVCRVQCLEYALSTGEEHGIWGGATEDERVIMKGILSSSNDPLSNALPESEPEIRKETCKHSPKPQRRPAFSIQPLVLNLPGLRESRNPVPLEKEVVLVAVGFSAPALTLRFS